MATARFAWGIDIGNRALKAIKLVRAGDRLKVDDFDVIEHEQILSNAGDNRENYINSSVAAFVGRHQMRGGAVAVGVSGQSSFARFIKLPPVERKKILEIVRFEAIQQIPFPLEEVEWSHQLFESPETPDIEVGIFAMRKELVAKHLEYFKTGNMNVTAVQMNPLAVYNAMYYDDRLAETTMIVDMGAENTDLVIADRYSVWHRSISIGGNAFTEALVKSFKLSFAKAEDLKRNAGTSKYTRQIFQAMRPVFADLVGEIQRSMGFFASVHRDAHIARVIALGGTFRLPNLQRYLQQNLQLEVVRMDAFTAGTPTDPKAAGLFNENLLSLAGAYGLAIQAMDQSKITSSLLPAEIRRERLWKEKTKWFALAAAMFVAGTGLGYGSMYMVSNADGDKEDAAKNDSIYKSANALSTKWADVEQGGAPLLLEIQKFADLMKWRMTWPNLIRDIHDALPMPQPEVVEGMKKWDAATLKKIPRNERKILTFDSVATQYMADLKPALAAPAEQFIQYASGAAPVVVPGLEMAPGMDMSPGMQGMPPGMGMPGMGMPGMPGMPVRPGAAPPSAAGIAAARGFLITIRCTSPYGPPAEGAQGALTFVQTGFIGNLLGIKFAGDPNRRYEVARAAIVSAVKVEEDPARLAEIQASWTAIKAGQSSAAAGGGTAGGYPGGMPGYSGGMPGYPGGMPGYPGAMPGYPGAAAGMPAGVNPGSVAGAPGTNPFADLLTDEDVRQDREFTVLLAVVLYDQVPATPTTGTVQQK